MADQAQSVPAPPPPPSPPGPMVPQAPQAPQAPQVPQAPQGQPCVHLNWSNFKPEFSGKPDEDAETHLVHTNYWMNVHHFNEGVKGQRFCLILLGEARLWCQSLEPINVAGKGYKIYLDNNTPKKVTLENKYSMHRDPSISMRIQKQ